MFDGDDAVYNGARTQVSGQIQVDMHYSGDPDFNENDNKKVTIIDKEFDLTKPNETSEYSIVKDGSINESNDGFIWKVVLDGIKTTYLGTEKLDFLRYKFEDSLSEAGIFDPASLQVNINGTNVDVNGMYDEVNKTLNYEFLEGSIAPIEITYETKMTEDEILSNGVTKKNSAKIIEEDLNFKEASKDVSYEPTWIAKKGVSKYNSTTNKEEVTWTIVINEQKASLTNVKLDDVLANNLTFISAKAEYYTDNTITNTVDFTSEPNGGIYSIGNISDKVVLTIITEVDRPANGFVSNVGNVTNDATVRWDKNQSGDTATSGNVGIGYNPINKTGQANNKDQTVRWSVSVDTRNQVGFPKELVTYDLMIHGTSRDNINYKGLQSGAETITEEGFDKLVRETVSYNQKFSEFNLNSSDKISFEKHEVFANGKHVADLLVVKINNENLNSRYSYDFTTRVINPEVTLGKGHKVSNTVHLYGDKNYLNSAQVIKDYDYNLTNKEVINRSEHTNIPNVNSANKTTDTEGYNYLDHSVVYRLGINVTGGNVSDVINTDNQKLGTVTITDTLPIGWDFVSFDNKDLMYYLYKTDENGNATELVTDLSIVDFTFTKSSRTEAAKAVFTFDNLDEGYVVLVKAKPSETLIKYYFSDNKTTAIINKLALNSSIHNPNPIEKNINVETEVLSKDVARPQGVDAGELLWTLEYNPYNVFGLYDKEITLSDTLPAGIELKRDSLGNIVDSSIKIVEYDITFDGKLSQVSSEIDFNEYTSFDPVTRELVFKIRSNDKAYKITYLTDIVGDPGIIKNTVKIIGEDAFKDQIISEFTIDDKDSSATLKYLGSLELKKVNVNDEAMSGVEFTIFNNEKNAHRVSITNEQGILKIRGLVPGEYTLKETKSYVDYSISEVEYKIEVIVEDEEVITKVNNELQKGPLEIVNHKKNTVGSLQLRKTVSGNWASKNKDFNFTVNFDGLAKGDIVQYVDSEDSLVKDFVNGDKVSLKADQVLTFNDLPEGSTYSIIEDDYTGEDYEETFKQEGEILADETVLVSVNNHKDNQVILNKVDENGKSINDANIRFNLEKKNLNNDFEIVEGYSDLKLNSEGQIIIKGLDLGEYRFIETVRSKDYALNTELLEFEVSMDSEGIYNDLKNLSFTNYQGSVLLSKTDEFNEPIEGVVYDFYLENSEDKATHTTDINGQILISDLAPGTYYFQEVSNPHGHIINSLPEQVIIVDEHLGKLELVNTLATNVFASASFNKKSEDGSALAGAEFELYLGRSIYAKASSDENGLVSFDGLIPGEYMIKELMSVDGYILNTEEIRFTVNPSTEEVKEHINLDDFINYQGRVIVNKVDENGDLLNKATFELLNEDLEVLETFKTKSGIKELDKLSPGRYFIRETKAPHGYKLSNDLIDFTIEDTSLAKPEAIEINVENTKLENVKTGINNSNTFFLLLFVLSGLIILINTRYYLRKRKV